MTTASTRQPVHPALALWLQRERVALNARLQGLRVRYPRAQAGPLLDAVGAWLSPFAHAPSARGAVGPASDALLHALFDLVTLHAARGTLGRLPGVRRLLSESLHTPALRALAERAPARLCAALSNAAERLGALDDAYVRAVAACAPFAESPDALLQGGAVVAWRLGEVRLRQAALTALDTLAPALGLAALSLSDWPQAAWPLARESLRRDTWTHPRALVSPALLDQLYDAPAEVALARAVQAVATPTAAPFERWQTRPPVGDFVGFGGRFARPPQLVALGDRHTLYLEVDSDTWRIDADLFGHRCAPCPLEQVPGVGTSAPASAPTPAALRAALPLLERSSRAAGASSLLVCDGLVALTLTRSHRVQLRVPPSVRV